MWAFVVVVVGDQCLLNELIAMIRAFAAGSNFVSRSRGSMIGPPSL